MVEERKPTMIMLDNVPAHVKKIEEPREVKNVSSSEQPKTEADKI